MTPEINNIVKLGIERLNNQTEQRAREVKAIRLRLTLAIIKDILNEPKRI